MKSRLGAPWSSLEVRMMRDLAKQGLSARQVAVRLKRSRGSVAFKAMGEGVRFHFINQPAGVQKRIQRRRFRKVRK